MVLFVYSHLLFLSLVLNLQTSLQGWWYYIVYVVFNAFYVLDFYIKVFNILWIKFLYCVGCDIVLFFCIGYPVFPAPLFENIFFLYCRLLSPLSYMSYLHIYNIIFELWLNLIQFDLGVMLPFSFLSKEVYLLRSIDISNRFYDCGWFYLCNQCHWNFDKQCISYLYCFDIWPF